MLPSCNALGSELMSASACANVHYEGNGVDVKANERILSLILIQFLNDLQSYNPGSVRTLESVDLHCRHDQMHLL